ncbi:MAG: NAD-binding protein, partial [Candidatus Hermodarchaeota archaeon]
FVMKILNFFIEIHLKLKQYKLAFLFLFLFWFGGFLTFLIIEPDYNLWEIFLFSWTVRSPEPAGDFGNLYSLLWPILLEVIVFGFIIGELLEKFNPIVTSRILASHKRNHTVIIGHHHLSERIIEYCVEHNEPFCLIEDNAELVEDLINAGYPIVIGDPTEPTNLTFANIKRAKEVFINVGDVRVAIICTEKIRNMNPECQIYVRAFEDHVQDYLKQTFNAFSFSTSKWAMKGIQKWITGKTGNVIVIGRDSLTHRIAYHLSQQPGREVFLFDDEHDGIEFEVNEQIHIINEFACFLSDLRPHVNLKEVTQIFICWKRESEFDELLYLTSKLNLRYPQIEVYVRIFDEELIDLVKNYNAKTFSTSKNAFKMLQKEVTSDSAIAPK